LVDRNTDSHRRRKSVEADFLGGGGQKEERCGEAKLAEAFYTRRGLMVAFSRWEKVGLLEQSRVQ
jgi:hypothetical protein